jgi:hypothetical protein
MINREFILDHFTKNIKQYQQYAMNIAGVDDADDLFQECASMLLEYSEERLISYWNKNEGLKPFFIRMLTLQYRSKTSYYHAKYRKQEQFINNKGTDIAYNDHATIIEDYEIDMNEVITAANSVSSNPYENLIWNLYVEHGSIRKALAALPGEYKDLFDVKLVHRIAKKFQRQIKKQLNIAE